MAVREWLRPPRHLLVLFVGITLVLAAALGWLGWRLLQQDRALETERVRERLESAANAVAAALELRLSNTEATLSRLASVPRAELPAQSAQWGRGLSPGAVLLVLTDGAMHAAPPGRLAYYPVLSPSSDPPPAAFALGEALEFRSRDYAAAAEAYRALARSSDRRIRAGALLRLSRALRKTGQLASARDAYTRLAELDSLPLDGLPAGLLARHARMTVLEALGQTADAGREASSLYHDLINARWPLTRGAFEFYSQDLQQRRGTLEHPANSTATAAPPPLVLAQAAEEVWQDWLAARGAARGGNGRRVLSTGAKPALVTWVGTSDRRLVLIATRAFLEAAWLPELEPLLDREGVRIALDDPDGNPVLTQLQGDPRPQVVRTTVETRLPFALRVASADPGRIAGELAARRRLMLAGFAVATVLVLVGIYAVARAVTRELAVARLQSDFVAAVSHEFRTPLTAMRQLTELLASGRVAGEDRRAQYYDVLKREGERLHRLVEGLLDFGRMEAGAQEFRFEPWNATALVRQTVEDFRTEASGRGYQVELEVSGADCTVRADREAFARALWNLLDNAVRYSPDHRTVWVRVGGEDGRVAISVQDRGAGIHKDEQNRVFQKFVRGSSAGVTNAKGTGIGLAMVHHIVKAHGGEIRLESEPGVGSTFTVMLDGSPQA